MRIAAPTAETHNQAKLAPAFTPATPRRPEFRLAQPQLRTPARKSMTSSQPEVRQETAPLRCFLVEDSSVIRENLIATLQELLRVEVVGYAPDERSAVEWMLANRNQCDFLIIDIFLKTGTGLEVLNQARALLPAARRIVLTNFATPDMRKRCEELGADAVFDKSAELELLLQYCESLQA